MPLCTQIHRNGEILPVKWGGFHVAAMVLATTLDSGQGPFEDNAAVCIELGDIAAKGDLIPISPANVWGLMDYGAISMTPLNHGGYTMGRSVSFVDIMDGEEFTIEDGDVLSAFRN